jgi:hypothetical protein
LFLRYTNAKDQQWQADFRRRQVLAAPASASRQEPDHDQLGKSSKGPGPLSANIAPMERLRGQIEELNCDLNRDLLTVYFGNHLWKEFLDCYLRSLHEAPNGNQALVWARPALRCAQDLGRTDEVLDALHHLTRFHPELRTARRLKVVLDEWVGGGSSSPELSRR